MLSLCPRVKGGGPFIINASSGLPVRWSRTPVRGGPLNSQTVDEQGRVIYHVDSGPLGPLTNAEAVAMVDRIFNQYNSIATSTIRFVNGGKIRNPNTSSEVDIDGSNQNLVLSSQNPTFQNPIIFDSDGRITNDALVLGFIGFLSFAEDEFGNEEEVQEALVVLNGTSIDPARGIDKASFLGVFTHEIAHFVGPLDHAQINGDIASNDENGSPPAGYTPGQLFDLFAPFTETTYPLLFSARPGSQLRSLNIFNSGPLIASAISLDTRIALSNLYPAPGYRTTDPGSQFGSISGRVIIRTSDGDTPVSGINVVARRISRGAYPPPPGLTAYPNNNVTLDQDGVPLPPPNRDETDPLATAASVVTGSTAVKLAPNINQGTGRGDYQFNGLPPGDYLISIEPINSRFTRGSSLGQFEPPIELPVRENYNGAQEAGGTSDNPLDFTPVRVTAGQVTSGIDIILNNYGGSPEAVTPQSASSIATAQPVSLLSTVAGPIRSDGSGSVIIRFGGTAIDRIEKIFKITVDKAQPVFISLVADTSTDPTNDGDLYLFRGDVVDGSISLATGLQNGSIMKASIGPPPSTEQIGPITLPTGSYFIGVSASDDQASRAQFNFTLKIITPSSAPVVPAPTVALAAPNGNDSLSTGGTFRITWTVTDQSSIASQRILLSTDGGQTFPIVVADNLAGDVRSFDWTVPVDLVTTRGRIRIVARNSAGREGQDDSDSDFSIVDRINPTVTITSPPGQATISGQQTITVDARDNIGVVSVTFFIDGRNVGEDTSAPFTLVLDTTTLANGNHTLSVTARDAAGNQASSSITVNVRNNRTPTIASVPRQVMLAGSRKEVPLTVSDPDGDRLTVTVTGAPFASIVSSGSNFTLRLAPGLNSPGLFRLLITVSDGQLSVDEAVRVEVRGDINKDNQVNVADLISLIQILSGAAPQITEADVNGDGAINVTDLIDMIQVFLNPG